MSLGQHTPLFSDGREDRGLVDAAVPRLAQGSGGRPLFPQRDRRPAKVGAWDSQMSAAGQLDEHGAHVAGIVFDPAAALAAVQQRRQRAIEVGDVEEAHTCTPNGTLLEGQEIEHESGEVLR